ncbi:MAG: pilus assembly protein PilM, partial [Chthoniobacterales bacterium]
MAASTRIFTLNLGSQTVALAEFRTQPNGGVVLMGYRLREILAEAGNDAVRNQQIASALREMMNDLRIKNGPVNYCVAAQSVFARFVKLPSVDEEKIERIIAFEAQQNVPFPIEEVVWDYQLVAAGGDEQIQVALVAIKSDLLEGINAAVEETGLQTQIVDVATMALYNAFRYNYSELTDCSLLVDIGARTTNLLFVEPGKIFTRSVPIGGGSISAAIAKEFNEPVAAAEFRKKRDGFVSLGGSYAEPSDPDVARVSKIVRSTLTRLHAELMRSISHYRAQQQGNAPARVLLCGGT